MVLLILVDYFVKYQFFLMNRSSDKTSNTDDAAASSGLSLVLELSQNILM
jgi:hypothetical protein